MTFKLLAEICVLFASLFIAGSIACLPVYHFKVRLFLASRLWVKICWWTPIFIVFVGLLYLRAWAAWVVVILLIAQAIREIRYRNAVQQNFVWLYGTAVAIGLVHLPFIFLSISRPAVTTGLIAICFASVLSDVVAFFMGTYLGRHHLPAYINAHKSYEGVAGQIIGAIIGLAVVASLPEIRFSWLLAVGVALASALGDIANSVVKRKLAIKDWGETIPGHGGVLDRFASLSFAIAVGYWVLRLQG